MVSPSSLHNVVQALHHSAVIVYPTEAVFGLGCDPDNQQAVSHLLTLKQRPIEKGLILVAAQYQQLLPYIDMNVLTATQWQTVLDSWPGPTTWVVPAKASTPKWLTGQFTSIAVRVSAHPIVQRLCHSFGKPVVSTSANVSGHPPCRTIAEVKKYFGQTCTILMGELGGRVNPSEIKDARAGQLLRQG